MGSELSKSGYIYDYRSGLVIDPETGEVVDQIYYASPVDGFARSRAEDVAERVHYEKFFDLLPKDVWFVFKNACVFLKKRGVAIDEKMLVSSLEKRGFR
jgi:hypothetical protein